MPVAAVGGLEVYYEVHGAGERVVLISGTGGDLRADLNRERHPLTERFEVLMYDQRGLGRTSKPDRPCSMSDYADDCVGLMDALGWGRAHMVGVSFGGMVGQRVVLRHPERVDKLVLACTSSGGAGGESFDLLSVADLPAGDRVAAMLPILDTRNDLSTDPPAYAPWFDVLAPRMAAAPFNADDPASATGARRQLEARAEHDTWDLLASVDAETFVIGRDRLPPGRGNGMNDATKVVTASADVAAQSPVVFELIADPARQPEWDGNDNLAEAPAGRRVHAVGDVFTMVLTIGAVRENHVVEFEEGRRIAWRPATAGEAPAGHLWRWEIEPIDEAHSRVDHTYDWSELTDENRFEPIDAVQ